MSSLKASIRILSRLLTAFSYSAHRPVLLSTSSPFSCWDSSGGRLGLSFCDGWHIPVPSIGPLNPHLYEIRTIFFVWSLCWFFGRCDTFQLNYYQAFGRFETLKQRTSERTPRLTSRSSFEISLIFCHGHRHHNEWAWRYGGKETTSLVAGACSFWGARRQLQRTRVSADDKAMTISASIRFSHVISRATNWCTERDLAIPFTRNVGFPSHSLNCFILPILLLHQDWLAHCKI